MKKALVCIDFIKEIMDESGKLSGKGYYDFAKEHNTLANVQKLQDTFRKSGDLVCHVKVGFEEGYPDHPVQSPLFGKAKEFGALTLGTPATEFMAEVAPVLGEKVIVKSRVSAFYKTELETYLQQNNIDELYIVGVATDLAVESAVRDAHDRDYKVMVVANACVAANKDVHHHALSMMKNIAQVIEG